MTPGFAKRRSQLPWLPYGKCNRVIINAHNFKTAFNPAVSGITPAVCWCPSRDTSGNGTSTVSDLSGNSRSGTLTNMDPATDWISDTGAGGVRALDFDSSNDFVTSTFSLAANSTQMLSAWFKTRKVSGIQFIATTHDALYLRVNGNKLDGYSNPFVYMLGTTTLSTNTWHHAVILKTSTQLRLYLNGTLEATASLSGKLEATSIMYLARQNSNTSNLFDGLIDDVRLFHGTAMGATEVSFLYGSGSGRGISA